MGRYPGRMTTGLYPWNVEILTNVLICRIYHSLLTAVLDSKIQNCDVKTLEIQTDFLCCQCRVFLMNLSALQTFSGLRNLIINLVNFNLSSTVGLYVHLFKIIFNIPSLESFEIRNIDSVIFQELKLWFHPDNIYFSRIRPFVFYTKSDSFLLRFGSKPPKLSV